MSEKFKVYRTLLIMLIVVGYGLVKARMHGLPNLPRGAVCFMDVWWTVHTVFGIDIVKACFWIVNSTGAVVLPTVCGGLKLSASLPPSLTLGRWLQVIAIRAIHAIRYWLIFMTIVSLIACMFSQPLTLVLFWLEALNNTAIATFLSFCFKSSVTARVVSVTACAFLIPKLWDTLIMAAAGTEIGVQLLESCFARRIMVLVFEGWLFASSLFVARIAWARRTGRQFA